MGPLSLENQRERGGGMSRQLLVSPHFFLWLLLSTRVIVLIALIFKILYLSQRLCFLWVHYLNPQNVITTNCVDFLPPPSTDKKH